MSQMRRINNNQESLLQKDVQDTLKAIQKSIDGIEGKSLEENINVLRKLRKAAYENINQHQHAALILKALKEFKAVPEYSTCDWYWHPAQTGGSDEPDLQGRLNGKIVLSAEITTSEKPNGTIRDRMKNTLNKLNRMEGEKLYVVQSDAMATAARNYRTQHKLDIQVVYLGLEP